MSKCHFDRVPQDKISSIRSRLQTYKDIFERAKTLNLQDDSSPKSTRDSIVQELESNYNDFFNEASPVINFANQAGTDFKQIEREARQTLEQVKTHSEEQKKQMENQKKSAESILESMRKASAEAGVSQEAIHYSEAQKSHSEQAQKWYRWVQNLLIGLIVSLFITGVLFVLFKGKEALVLGYLEITTLIITSLWIYAINFCNKNFHAEKHNETVNANKAKTLATFSSFVEATKDENIKNQVLLHASTSAFSNPPTGFGKNQGVPLSPGMELAKMIRGSSEGG